MCDFLRLIYSDKRWILNAGHDYSDLYYFIKRLCRNCL